MVYSLCQWFRRARNLHFGFFSGRDESLAKTVLGEQKVEVIICFFFKIFYCRIFNALTLLLLLLLPFFVGGEGAIERSFRIIFFIIIHYMFPDH